MLCAWNRVLATGRPALDPHQRSCFAGNVASGVERPERHRLVVHLTFGTQAYEGDYHRCGFTEVLLRDYLRATGFDQLEFGPLYDDWMLQVAAVKVGPPTT